jgi:hypothetical protein
MPTENLEQLEMRSAKWPRKQAVWMNPLLSTSKKGDVDKSILATLGLLVEKDFGRTKLLRASVESFCSASSGLSVKSKCQQMRDAPHWPQFPQVLSFYRTKSA